MDNLLPNLRSNFSQNNSLASLIFFLGLGLGHGIFGGTCDLRLDPQVTSWDALYDLDAWIDGSPTLYGSGWDRAHAAFLLHYNQTPEDYIEKVIFTDNDKNILYAVYWNSENKISNGWPPYIIIRDVNLSLSSKYFLYVQVRNPSSIKKFRSVILPSKFSLKMLGENKNFPGFLKTYFSKVSDGFFNSPSVYKPGNESNLSLRSAIKTMDKNGNFSLETLPDRSWSYLLVTDPVGRLLGLKIFEGPMESYTLEALTESERLQWGILKDQVGKINDCPYIWIFGDDGKESIFSQKILLH